MASRSSDRARHVVIGTAGHVDHGKTTLTKALTGVDTDRLKEEKERALSIDLGFAPLTLPSGRSASVVDVPGHERFIKNMVAGVTGMDVVILVIAADEGVMPQTREHLDIVTLLDVRSCVVALTKVDMVEPDWLELMTSDVASQLEGTPFAGADIVPCSGITGEGCDRLLECLDDLAEEAEERDTTAPFLLAVDRVFVMKGFGTVATGTAARGRVQVGDEVEILPRGQRTRVRSIQVHGEEVEQAVAGHRAALNLQGITLGQVERGDSLSVPDVLRSTSMLDVSVRVLERASRPLSYWDRVRVHLGTAEVIARAALLGDVEQIGPGETGFVQLRLETPSAAAAGAQCVLRTYSPSHTFAGGRIVDPCPSKHRGQRRRAIVSDLQARAEGSPEELLDRAVRRLQGPASASELLDVAGLGESSSGLIEAWLSEGRLVELRSGSLISRQAMDEILGTLQAALAEHHEQHPLRAGIDRGDVRRLMTETPQALVKEALSQLVEDGLVAAVGSQSVRLRTHEVQPTDEDEAAAEGVLGAAASEEYVGVTDAEATDAAAHPQAGELLGYLEESGQLIRVGDRLLHHECVGRARSIVVALLRESGAAKVGEIRDALSSSRKAVVPLLEYMDRAGITRRQGDDRALGPSA